MKCVLTILELNWNKPFSGKNTNVNICHYMLTLSTQLQNMSFHFVERTRTSAKCRETKNACAKLLFFRCQICKFLTFLLPSSSWLLKLPIDVFTHNIIAEKQAIKDGC